MMDSLEASVMKQPDPDLVLSGAPSFLLLIDGVIEGAPHDKEALMAGARLYSAYISSFPALGEDLYRAGLLTKKARSYAFSAMSLQNRAFAQSYDKPFEQFQAILPTLHAEDSALLFLVISTWAKYIETHQESWDNLADIAKVEALCLRLLELDETHYYGSGHLALGVMQSILPAALGGRPEQARTHFERAVRISDGKFLPAYVIYARYYARPTFNRPLYDGLLQTVVETPADTVPELTLINTIAQKQARKMLTEVDEYFVEAEPERAEQIPENGGPLP